MAELYPIPMNEASDAFLDCLDAAVNHLGSMPTDHAMRFCNLSSSPPWSEHLCFLLGNQIFFVCVEDAGGVLASPSGIRHTIMTAEQASGIPCVMEMQCSGGVWGPARSGWSLRHAVTDEPVTPPELVTPQKIVISDWELLDFAIERVCDEICKDGGIILSKSPDDRVLPSLFFQKANGQEFVQVYAGRYPNDPEPNLVLLREMSEQTGCGGYFALVTVASEHDQFDSEAEEGFPLHRGDGYFIKYGGLVAV
jgi:hypothetical protein